MRIRIQCQSVKRFMQLPKTRFDRKIEILVPETAKSQFRYFSLVVKKRLSSLHVLGTLTLNFNPCEHTKFLESRLNKSVVVETFSTWMIAS